MSTLGNSWFPTEVRRATEPTATRIMTIVVPARSVNGALISLFSHFSPTQLSVDPVLLFVEPQAQMKQVFPALLISEHWPRPLHELVPLVHASAVVKQDEIEPIGWGLGIGKGAWDCSGCEPCCLLVTVESNVNIAN